MGWWVLLCTVVPPGELALVEGVELALQGERASAVARFKKADDAAASGLTELLHGRRAVARTLLQGEPKLVRYLAMAQAEGPGGLGRARETLAKASEGAGVDFLLALAFAESGQPEQADRKLASAVAKSTSVLDEAFAPDPAVGLVRHVWPRLSAASKDRVADALLSAGRHAEVIRLKRNLVDVWAPIDPRRARKHAKTAEDRARVYARLGEKEKVREALAKASESEASILWIRAEVALEEGRTDRAVEAAQDAARLEPKAAEAPYWVARTLFAAGENDRAHAFAKELLRRKPITIDPFGLLADIQEARGRAREVPALRLRSQGHLTEQKKLKKAQRRREAVIAAVRDAERGLGTTGLEAVRTADPTYSLTVDLALAKLGRGGTARAARDRILAACRGRLRRFLSRREPWDRVSIDLTPYGRVQRAHAPLSAADPGRCGGRVLRK